MLSIRNAAILLETLNCGPESVELDSVPEPVREYLYADATWVRAEPGSSRMLRGYFRGVERTREAVMWFEALGTGWPVWAVMMYRNAVLSFRSVVLSQ